MYMYIHICVYILLPICNHVLWSQCLFLLVIYILAFWKNNSQTTPKLTEILMGWTDSHSPCLASLPCLKRNRKIGNRRLLSVYLLAGVKGNVKLESTQSLHH